MRKFSIGYRGKLLFIVIGLAIGVASLIYSNYLVGQLRDKERHEVHLWSFAVGETVKAASHGNRQQAAILARIIDFSDNIPVIVCDDHLRVLQSRRIDPSVMADPERLADKLESMRSGGRDPIEIPTAQGRIVRVFYDESPLLKALQYFPWIQLGIFSVFIGFAFIAFRSSKHSEQNRVWIGMAKETAHQLGTPTSSLLGWLEYLRAQEGIEPFVVDEMNKDLTRLLKVVDRFSKIGATTNLAPRNIYELVSGAVDYFRTRIPKNVTLNFARCTAEPMQGMVNDALFEWVVENLLKNALDALQGRGSISVQLSVRDAKWICIDVRDSGKGMPKANFKRIFQPGFTTKTRGWGLGLSLSKRIIEEYHNGRIFVLDSEINHGTTMRVMVRKF
ncbi:MAG: sensor histidine kinase [Rikenella sp.]|nr:sensor histidine kinase [Rikenella sp.]